MMVDDNQFYFACTLDFLIEKGIKVPFERVGFEGMILSQEAHDLVIRETFKYADSHRVTIDTEFMEVVIRRNRGLDAHIYVICDVWARNPKRVL